MRAQVPALLRDAGRRPAADLAPLPRALAADPDAYWLVRRGGRAGIRPVLRALRALRALLGAGVAVEPGQALVDRDAALGGEVQVGPRADEQPDGHAPAGERAVLLQGLLDEQVLPAADQQHRDRDPLQRGTASHRRPERVAGLRVIHPSLDQAGPRPITSANPAATGRRCSTWRSRRSAVTMRAIPRSIPMLSWCATRSLHMT